MSIRKKILLYVGILFVTVLLLMVVIFNMPINAEDLPGTYEANTGSVINRIVINPDGTFVQTVTVTSPVIKASGRGTWEYYLDSGNIHFSAGCLVPIDGSGKLIEDFAHNPATGSVVKGVRRGFYGIQLGVHPALRFYKQD